VNEKQLFESPDLTMLDICLWVWMWREVYKRKMGKPDKLLASILDAAARTRKPKDQLRRTARDFRTRVAKCSEDDSGICEHLL
jgi:hypothetical protein